MGMAVEESAKNPDDDEFRCDDDEGETPTDLTVMKTSLFFAGDGFTAYDRNCRLVFRVDSYGGPDKRDRDELLLMDATGHCLLTVRRKWPSLHQRWEGFTGEGADGAKPVFSVRRSSIIGRSSVTVERYTSDPAAGGTAEYLIEGSFPQRTCTFYDLSSRSVVADIKRKVDASTNVVVGKDVFVLSLKKPRSFDATFAMGIVLVLDQICGDDDNDDDVEVRQDDDVESKAHTHTTTTTTTTSPSNKVHPMATTTTIQQQEQVGPC